MQLDDIKTVAPDNICVYGRMNREVHVLRKYKEFVVSVAKTYNSLEEYVLWNLFKRATRLRRIKSRTKLSVIDKHETFEWRVALNDYPYHIAPNLSHYVLWMVAAMDSVRAERVDDILSSHFCNKEYHWFVNTADNQSVPGLFHAHVFVITS